MTNEKNYISQEETLNKINALIAEYIPLMPTGWTLPLNIAKTINELPSVTPSRPKGKWEVEHKSTGGYTLCVCSNCKDYYTMTHYEMKYCPNCGADMRESEDK